jgi:flavin-dependent dehydrogenase
VERNGDLLIVGAGPAGLASVIAARRFDLNVMVVDGRRAPINRPCGEGLMPDGVATLDSFGKQPLLNEAAPLQGIRFLS